MDLGEQVCQLLLGGCCIRIIVFLARLEDHLAGHVRGIYVHDHSVCWLDCDLYVASVTFASFYGLVKRGERVSSSPRCAIVAIHLQARTFSCSLLLLLHELSYETLFHLCIFHVFSRLLLLTEQLLDLFLVDLFEVRLHQLVVEFFP